MKEWVEGYALLRYDLYRAPLPFCESAICAAEARLFCTRKVGGGLLGEMGIGMGDEARGLRYAAWGEEFGELEAGVRARDARSGSSRDFFLLRSDL